jgi:alpha-N-arabinofuranosidase
MRKCKKRRVRRNPSAGSGLIEELERRRLLSVGTIPTVPTPAAHWTFDQGTGTTATDSSGNGYTATLGAGASWVTGNVGTNAISVNGSSTGVATVTRAVVNTAGSFTASAWVDLASLSGYQTVLSIAGSNVAGFFLQFRSDTGTFAFTRLASDSTSAATTYVSAPTAPTTGTWYHIVGVDDASAGTLALYVDGQSMGSAAYTGGWAATGNTLIGHGFYGGSQVDYVNGAIDDVEMFSSALSAAQVVALDQPAAYSFDDGTGTTAADVSGHGNTLTLGSGASWAAGRLGSNSLAVNGSATGNATFASPVINTALSFSVSAWVNLNSISGNQTFVSIDGTNTSAFYLQLNGSTGTFAFTRLASDSDTAQNYQADATSAATTGVWYNLIGVNDVATSQILLYVNGALQSTVSYTGGWQATGKTVIGGGLFNGVRTDFATGDIDDVHFYDSPVNANDAAYIGTAGNSTVNIATGTTGATVSPTLFGAFLEDINYSAEGGLYNDEVRNSGFNDSTNALNSWSAITSSGVSAALTSDTTTGPTTALTQSGALAITSGVSSTARAGISNSGYFGVAIAPSTSYTVEFYAKATSGFTGPLTADLESTTGTVFATATISSITSAWAPYTATITTSASTPTTATNVFVISTTSPTANGQTIWFGATYLYPPAYQGASNHLRIDLMQKIAALSPAIFRVPGGNYLESDTNANHFEWSNTIGPVQDRPGHYNSAWGYWSTDGMGLDEYLQMAEEVGAQPILAVYAGYTLNGSSDTGTTLTNDVTDAVNELHYCLDATTTSWGAERAANGHAAPYNINYVEVGNEDFFSSTYATRYPLFYNAIHAAFPSLQIIATSSSTGGSPYNVLDEHFYETPAWFEANSGYFNNVTRGSSKVFIGEYAADQGSPTNDMNSALGDASWLLGLERNSDLVTMSSYAPLLVDVNGYQWSPDLIGFNNTTSYGSPSYYAQVMLSNNHGTTVVSDTVNGASGLQVLVTKTGDTYYMTVVNTLGAANTTTVNLAGVTNVSSTASATSLVGLASNATNSITNPTAIVPTTSTVSGLGTSFQDTFPGYSITILQFTAAPSPPTVQTPAGASPSPVTGTTANLSVLGADSDGQSNLTYTWATTGTPPAAVNFSANGTNAAANTTATFIAAGTYSFQVTITDPGGLTTTSTTSVTVDQTPVTASISPSSPTVGINTTTQFIASAVDQFGNPISTSSAVTWSLASGSGSLSSNGLYTAPATAGTATVTANLTGYGTLTTTLSIVADQQAWYKMDSTSGTTVVDSSGRNENGTIMGSTSWTSGVSGNALDFTGGNASLPNNIMSGLTNFTISTWVDVTSLVSWERIFDFGSGTSKYMFLTPDNGATNTIRFSITTGGSNAEQQLTGPAIAANTWTNIAVTLSGSIGTLYVDGTAVATNTSMSLNPSSLGNTNHDYLGKSQFSGDPALSGLIDDVRIYNRALSAAQVAQLALPTLVNIASGSPNPVTGTSTSLSVLGADVTAGASALTYTWSTTGTPPAQIGFSANGTNAAQNTTATFAAAGTYNLLVTIENPVAGLTTTSAVTITVAQTVVRVVPTPSTLSLYDGQTDQYSALAYDQFGAALAAQPAFSWSASGAGTISGSGLFNAGYTAGGFFVTASAGGLSGNATGTVSLPTWLGAGSIAAWDPSTDILTVTGAASIVADPGSDEPTIEATGSSAVATINPLRTVHVGGLTLSDGAALTVSPQGTSTALYSNPDTLIVGLFTSGATPTFSIDSTSEIDLTNNDLIIAGISEFSMVQAEIAGAYDGGKWDLSGITSSSAAINPQSYGLGYATATAINASTFDGQNVSSGAVLVKYTLLGDATLAGNVGLIDYQTVVANYNSGTTWTQGAFHPGSNTGLSDYNAILANYNVSATANLVNSGTVGDGSLQSAIITPSAAPAVSYPVAGQNDLQLVVSTTTGDVALENTTTAAVSFTSYDIGVKDDSANVLLIGNPTGKGSHRTGELLLSGTKGLADYNPSAAADGNIAARWRVVQDGYSSDRKSFGLSESFATKHIASNGANTITLPAGGLIDLGRIFNTLASHSQLEFSWQPENTAGGDVLTKPFVGRIDFVSSRTALE